MSVSSDATKQLEDALRRCIQTLKRPQRWAEVTRSAGITLDRPAAVVLHMLHERPARLHELAERLGVEAPTVTRKTQELERAALLIREADPRDRRAVRLALTPAGKRANRLIHTAYRDQLDRAMQGWSVSDRQAFVGLLEKFADGLAADGAVNQLPQTPSN